MAQSGGPGMSALAPLLMSGTCGRICEASGRNKARGSKVARRAFSYRGAGKVRRRIRRLVRSRFFNNARTATRNLDLPLAIATPSLHSSSYCIGGFWPVHGGHNGGLFWHPPVRRRPFFKWRGDFRTGRGHVRTCSRLHNSERTDPHQVGLTAQRLNGLSSAIARFQRCRTTQTCRLATSAP